MSPRGSRSCAGWTRSCEATLYAPRPNTTGLTLPGTESRRAIDLLDERFPAANVEGATATIVLRAPDGQSIGDADARKARDRGLAVEGTGDALPVAGESSTLEIIGFALAGIVLVITFGSLSAAGLPLVTALLGVGVSLAAITALGSAPTPVRRSNPAPGRAPRSSPPRPSS
ncbi:MMPL family transporter [Streptomyces sp. NPDC048565]|uniref:MMPL family transporter n=1 Tax=Streptomyces sp. NPDC048565 TaxID=3155266 RepID=UPI0034393954